MTGEGLPPVLLVAEDDATQRGLLTDVLRRNFRGYDVHACEDGLSADTADRTLRAQGRDIALVLSDLVMPNMDGLELFGRIAERDPDCARVVLTGEAAVDSAVASLRLGVEDYLLKPYSERELVQTLTRHLERRRLRRANERLRRELAFSHRFVSKMVEGALGRMDGDLSDVLELPNVAPEQRRSVLAGRRALDLLARAYRVKGSGEDGLDETFSLTELVERTLRNALSARGAPPDDPRVTVLRPERSVEMCADSMGVRIALSQLIENALENGTGHAEVVVLGEGRNWPPGVGEERVPVAVRERLSRDHVAVMVTNTAAITREDEATIRRVLDERPDGGDAFLGLGLPLARLYATILGGEIVFQWSSKRSQVVFTLVLPRHPATEQERRARGR